MTLNSVLSVGKGPTENELSEQRHQEKSSGYDR
jgi:hypothetical protein